MSKKFFVFKTANTTPTYIGYNLNPSNEYKNDVIYGIEYTDKDEPRGSVIYRGKDKTGNDLIVIENPGASIMNVKDFDQKYTEYTRGIKLLMTPDKFSECVGNVIKELHSGKSSTPVKKTSVKKKSVKKEFVKKGGRLLRPVRKKKSKKIKPIKNKLVDVTKTDISNDDEPLERENISTVGGKKHSNKKSKRKSIKKGGKKHSKKKSKKSNK